VITGVLILAPCIALAIVLLLGRYPGERTLVKRASQARARPARRRSPMPPRWSAPIRRTSGGLLLARSLAGRAPPSARSLTTA
jgi:hypothetical protein